MKFVLLITSFLTLTTLAQWDYDENGPHTWPDLNNAVCDGNRNSPIDIRSSNVVNEFPVCPDTHRYFNWQFNFNHNRWLVKNDGKALILRPVDANGDPLSRGNAVSRFYNELFDDFKNTEAQQYCLDQVHFHVGRRNCEGSEHTIEGKPFPLEVHWVHTLCSFENDEEAFLSDQENAFSVIGMFFEVSDIDNPSLDTFINEENINKLIPYQASFISDSVSMKELLPCDGYCGMADENFWFYDGGITAPPCNEIVRWQIFEQTSYVSKLQLQLLRRMEQSDGTQFGFTGTFRPPQYAQNNRPLNYVYEDCTQ